MENELFSVLEDDAQDRNTHRACLRAVARAQKQFGSFFKQAASEEDFMARLDLVNERINDVVREACIEEGSASLDTVARVLAGELARTSEVMRDDVKEEDIAPSDGEDDQMHVRGIAGRKLLGLDDQEGESKTAMFPGNDSASQEYALHGKGDAETCQHGYTACPDCFPGEHGGNKAMDRMRADYNNYDGPESPLDRAMRDASTHEAAPRKKPTPKMDEGTGRMYQPDKNPPRKKKAPADPNAKDSLDPMKNKNVVRTPDSEKPLGKPVNQKQLDWEKKNKNKVRKEPEGEATNKPLSELEKSAVVGPPGEPDRFRDTALEHDFPRSGTDTWLHAGLEELTPEEHQQKADQAMQELQGGNIDEQRRQQLMYWHQRHQQQADKLKGQLGTPWPETDTSQIERGPTNGYGITQYQGKTAVETGDTYTQETVDLPSANDDGLSQDPSPKMDKGTAGDENHTSQKPIEVPSVRNPVEQQDVTDTADYTKTLDGGGVIKSINADSPLQPELSAAPNTQAFPNKDQANPVTSKWKVLG